MEEEIWDETEVYQREIEPAIKQAHSACRRHNVPFIAVTSIACDEEGNQHSRSTGVICGDRCPALIVAMYALLQSEELVEITLMTAEVLRRNKSA